MDYRLREEMERILPPGQIRYEEPMDRHCSFRTGGPADVLACVRSEKEMVGLLSLLRRENTPFFLLGRGTNLLIGDGGYRGVIVTAADPAPGGTAAGGRSAELERAGTAAESISAEPVKTGAGSGFLAGPDFNGAGGGSAGVFPETGAFFTGETGNRAEAAGDPSLTSVRVQGNRLTAGAGATLKAAAMAAMACGLSGLEFAAGIPGTVGGGLVMNAGAYDGEMKQVVRSVRLLMPDGQIRICTGGEMAFGYRDSLLRRIPAVALEAELELTPGDPEEIRARIRDLAAQRREKQPLEYPSAGSTFKRPEGNFAGKLIMDAGLRGFRIGDAQVSEKHCGFIINRGSASSAQIRRLIEEVQRKVFEDSGVQLEREVIYLGEF